MFPFFLFQTFSMATVWRLHLDLQLTASRSLSLYSPPIVQFQIYSKHMEENSYISTVLIHETFSITSLALKSVHGWLLPWVTFLLLDQIFPTPNLQHRHAHKCALQWTIFGMIHIIPACLRLLRKPWTVKRLVAAWSFNPLPASRCHVYIRTSSAVTEYHAVPL